MKVRTIVLCSLFCGCSGSGSTRPPAAASESQPVEDPAALKAIDEGERTIEASGGDCAQSCGALAKITSARLKLCSPRTSACPDAERREDEARRTVASYCGKCP
ncbi:MAG: hypothetical protein ACXVEF_03715 [Polyangiales bacterium]